MIIFDLDRTLADCEHRRHFVDKNKTWCKECHKLMSMEPTIDIQCLKCGVWPTKWKTDWKAFYEACDKDMPIEPVISMLRFCNKFDWEIWSGRCESVREKTIDWLYENIPGLCGKQLWNRNLKMRPIGDLTPDDKLKERFLDEYLIRSKYIENYLIRNETEFVFDSDPKSIEMWRRRGVFVFNCCQH